jgi:hypothetical protein
MRGAVCLLLLPTLIHGQQQVDDEQARAHSPRLSNYDLPVTRPASGAPDDRETITRLNGEKGTPIRNPLAVLRGSLSRMNRITSLRTHLQSSSSDGTRDLVAETIKPDRMRIISPDAEIIVIGHACYIKRADDDWQVTKSTAALSLSAPVLDYAQFVNKMLATPGLSITGRLVGDEVIDGYTTIAYEFTIAEGRERGIIEACVGKDDGFLRRLFLFAPSLTLKAWFTGINETFTIEKPQM